jgi:hypothetical protein
MPESMTGGLTLDDLAPVLGVARPMDRTRRERSRVSFVPKWLRIPALFCAISRAGAIKPRQSALI